MTGQKQTTEATKPDDNPLAIPELFRRKKDEAPKYGADSGEKQATEATKTNGQADKPETGPKPAPKQASKGKAKAKGTKPAAKAKGTTAAKKQPSKATNKKAQAKPTAKPKAKAQVKKEKPVAKAKASKKVERDKFGFKVGTVTARAAALYARKEGATTPEVKKEFGGAQLNLLKDVTKSGFTVKKTKEKGETGRPTTRYFIT